jgi:regulator of replication initiation timing
MINNQARSNQELNLELNHLRTKLNNLWGPFSFVLSPIFNTMDPTAQAKTVKSSGKGKNNLTISIDDDVSMAKLHAKKVSPKSS